VIRAGIDEAGYGPLLGPLVTALAAFRHDGDEPDLWAALSDAVCRDPSRPASDPRLPVADSKALYRGGEGFALLETVALSFSCLASGEDVPRNGAMFLARHAGSDPPHCDRYPWYACGRASIELPLKASLEQVLEATARLRQAAKPSSARPMLLAVLPLLEGEYNERVERRGTKARALFDMNVDLLQRLRRHSREPATVTCDRHGGRRYYADLLSQAFPMERVVTRSEGPKTSGYEVGSGESRLRLTYVVEGEKHGMEVALASVFAKYTRELFVERLNRHFAARLPGLRRTAGYYTDAVRFLEDLDRGNALSFDERELLVRCR